MRESKLLIVIAFFSIYVIWGSTYLLNKIVVSEVSPLSLASIRFFISGSLILLIARLLQFSIKITKQQLINSAVAGFLFLVYGNGVFVWALKYVDSGFAALLASTQPLFILLLMRLIDRKKMQKKSIIGVVLGFVGMYLLVSQNDIVASEGTLLGTFMIFTCLLSWSYGSVFVAKANLHKNFFVSTGYQMVIGGVLLSISSLLFNESWSSPLEWSSKAQLSMVLLILFGSIVAFTAFNYLLKVVSPEKVSTNAYVNPVVALLLGWYFLDEQLTLQSIIASIVLLSGVYFITSRKRKTNLTVPESDNLG
ncbi:EamA family transporter [Tenacibaculum sp. IB213877]|uniref:EamA family transporter n=1 Tax=Tenacibaculum sp. IB213877 TaxID=3097351 RepID=UPI002A5A8BF6|nr:EamA family transporter [Tenacibaculum sp. IB213877]MDY0779553.1 EamA family transporter [Tenacibaculum sp. IB213877]